MTTGEIAAGVLKGSPRSIGRAITAAESGGADVAPLIGAIYPSTGRARIFGVTGPPGAGKSTLVCQMARRLRTDGLRVGIVAVDPSSPFSGGAILGDRIRMSEIYTDPGVFIRSMATRGSLGGLARATGDAVDILDAAGYDIVIIETVGVGQAEVDIVSAADSIAVVLVPGLGDDIQALKAGILEIADVFVVNKSDREGADRTAAELAMALDLAGEVRPWRPPIVKAAAARSEGIDLVCAALEAHQDHLATSGLKAARRLDRSRVRLTQLLSARFLGEIHASSSRPDGLEAAAASVAARREDPYAAAGRLFERVSRR